MRFLILVLSFSSATFMLAQPPTKVDVESRADIYEDSYPSTASARGSAIARYRYAPTPSMQEAKRESKEIAGANRPSVVRRQALSDGNAFGYNTGVYAMRDAYDYDVEPYNDAWGQEVGSYRRSYDQNGQLIGVDRFRRGVESPDLSYRYSYPSSSTVVEEQIMPDGSTRFVREVTVDEFQASQGPGNQPYLNNRAINQHYENSNSTLDRPTSPGGSSTTPSSPY